MAETILNLGENGDPGDPYLVLGASGEWTGPTVNVWVFDGAVWAPLAINAIVAEPAP
jgi:hypothetical protein